MVKVSYEVLRGTLLPALIYRADVAYAFVGISYS